MAYFSETNFRYMFSMVASSKGMNSSKLQGNGLSIIKERSVASSTKSTTSAAFKSSSRVPIFHTVSVSKN